MLSSTVAATGQPSSFAVGVKESHATIRAEQTDEELVGSMFKDRPVQDFGHGHEAHVQRKLTKTRERPRIVQCRLQMMALNPMHPSRMSFLEASGRSEGAAVGAVLSSFVCSIVRHGDRVCCVVESRRNRRRVSVTGLDRVQRHTATRELESHGEHAQKPVCGSALVLARRGSVAGETVKPVRTHAFPMSVRTYAG